MINPNDPSTATVAYVFPTDDGERVGADIILWADSDPTFGPFGPEGTSGSGRVARGVFGLAPGDVTSPEHAALVIMLSVGIQPRVCHSYEEYLRNFADALSEAGHPGALRPLTDEDLYTYEDLSPATRADVEVLWSPEAADALGLESLNL